MHNGSHDKKLQRERRHRRIRARLRGTADRPRLAVFRSNRFTYAQLIDDGQGHTLAHAVTVKGGGNKVASAAGVGTAIAKAARAQKIERVVFDRASYLYAGRVRALAEAARKGGLKF